jgi:hypothetical protein
MSDEGTSLLIGVGGGFPLARVGASKFFKANFGKTKQRGVSR